MKKTAILVFILIQIFILSGCSLSFLNKHNETTWDNITNIFSWDEIDMPTENINNYRVYTTTWDIQILPWRWQPEWVRNANIDEPKFIWLARSLSYETSFGSQKYFSVVHKTKLDISNWEIQRFIREQDLTKTDTDIQNIFTSKIQKNKKELNLLGVDTTLLDDISTNQTNLVIYSKAKIYKNKEYLINLYYTEDWVMIDIYDKGTDSNTWNNTIIQTQTKTLWDKTYKKVKLVPFAPSTNGPDLACKYMKLIDENDTEIQIPAEIRKYTICEDVQVVSPNFRFVLYNYFKPTDKESSFVLYDIPTNKTYTIWTEFIWVDTLKCQWSADSTHIVCAVVWQEWLATVGDINTENLPYISKFIIFELWENFGLDWNTRLLSKKEIFQKNSETIQFVCWDSCYIPDFVVWKKEIKYTWHEILADSKWFSIQYR